MRKFFQKIRKITAKQIFTSFLIFVWVLSSVSLFFGFVGKTERVTAAPTFMMDTGHFVGDGFSKAITGLGFTPDLVIIKSDTTATAAMFKTTAMQETATAYLGSATNDTNTIVLDADGFTAFGTADNAGVIYTWTAFGGSDCSATGRFCVGAYTGDGAATAALTAVGFQPDLVWIKQSLAAGVPNWRSSAMGANVGQYFTALAQDATGVLFRTLDATGFTVGLNNNAAGGIYYYVAFKEVAGSIDVGTYTNAVANDNTNIGGVGFVPDMVFVKNSAVAVSAVYNVDESYGDNTSYFAATANLTNSIQALQTDGFQVGTSNTANGATNVMYYAAFTGNAAVTSSGTFTMASGSYTGDGGSKTFTNLGFAPDLVIIKGDGATAGVFRTSAMAGDVTAYLDSATANVGTAITMLNLNGFTIGNHASVNTNGRVYYWTAYGNAWKQSTNTGASDFFIGAYTGNGIDSRNITRLPFQPDMVTIKAATAVAGTFRTSAMAGDLSGFFAATAEAANNVQAFNTDGFQVGTAGNVNTLATVYYYFGFKSGSNFEVGTYDGTGVAKDVPVSFQPDNIWVKRTTNTRGVSRTSDDVGDGALPFINAGNVAGAITGIIPTGFSVGTAAETNTALVDGYRYVAWKNNSTPSTPVYHTQTGYFVGNGASKRITGLGFTPQLVILKSDNNAVATIFKTVAMPQNATAYLGSATVNGNFIEFVPDGFDVVGTANTANVRYTWIAFNGSDCTATGIFCVGTYTGTGVSPLALTEVGFQPDLVWVKGAAAVAPNWRSSSMGANVGQYFTATAEDATGALFRTLDATGFTVGATNNVGSAIFYYAAFKEVAGSIDVGTFNGDGLEGKNVAGVGFVPDYMFLKNSAQAVSAVSNQNESYGDSSSYFSLTANLADSIQALQTDGFNVGTNATANGAGNAMYYAAFDGASLPGSSGTFKMTSGSYVGNGDTQTFSNLDFAPNLVIIKGDTAQFGVFRTSNMAGNSTAYLGSPTANLAGAITTMNISGFTVGNSVLVNSPGVTYYWTAYGNAWNAQTASGASDFIIGAYYGSGTDSRNIARLPFQPNLVAVKRFGASEGVWRTSSHSGDTSSYFSATSDGPNNIQSINSNGFQVGTNAMVNTLANVYFYFAFKSGSNFSVGQYSGTGVAKNVTTVGFQPDNLWVKHNGATRGILRTSQMATDSALPFLNATSFTGAVTDLISSGFSIGLAGETNISGLNNYRYAAWKANVLSQVHYHWRADNGSEAAATSLTGGAEDTPYTGIVPGTTYRLRMEVSNGGSASVSAAYRLEYGEKTSSCAVISSWTRVGDALGDWDMSDSGNLTNGDNTTNIAKSIGGVTDENVTFLTPNAGVRDTSDETGSLTLSANKFAELEYSIEATADAPAGTVYCFRVTDAGSALPGYGSYAEAVVPNDVWVSAVGSHVSTLSSGASNQHVGGSFALADQNGSRTVTGITITETGTIDAQNNLKSIKLFYELDSIAPYNCADETYGGGEAQFGSTDADGFSSANGTSAFTDSVGISTTATMCVYVVVNVGAAAHNNETIGIEITAPRSDVTLSSGLANPPYAVAIDGIVTVKAYKMQTGYYVGSGVALTKTISGLGFTPEAVIIKSDQNTQTAMLKTVDMPVNATAYLGSATADADFIRLTSDGFTITSTSNTVNVRYTYIAFSGSDCSPGGIFCTGSYSGNGISPQSIYTGFAPDLAIVKRSSTVAASWRSSAMGANIGQYFMATVQDATGVLFSTLDATGFSVGSTNNASGGNYYFIAWKQVAGSMNVGTYAGTGLDNVNIPGVGFVPDFVFVKNATRSPALAGMYNVDESYGDNSSYFSALADIPNTIQALQADGFQVGSNNIANGSGNTFYYAAFAGNEPHSASGTFVMKTGTYVGTGGAFSLSGFGFSPDLVIIKGNVATAGVFRTKMINGDSTAYLDSATTNFALGITSLDGDGFSIGTSAVVNTAATNYYWTAYGNAWNPETHTGAADFFIGSYYGNGIDSRNITRIPFQPDLVAIKPFAATAGVFRTSAMAGDLTGFYAATAEAANMVQSLRADGFQVGTGANVNTAAVTNHWNFGFKVGDNFAVGTYSGTGAPQNIPVGFQPDNLWVKRITATRGVSRTSAAAGNQALPFIAAANVNNVITNLIGTGFSVNNVIESNTAGANAYRYVAWQGKRFDQSGYRWFANTNTTDVGAPLANRNTSAKLANLGDPFRLRVLLHLDNANLFASSQDFKLQFATSTGACDTGFVGETYQDVTATTLIAYNNNTPADGAALTANGNDPTHGGDTVRPQSYEEANNFTNSVSVLAQGTEDGEWDFALVDNGAPAFTSYCFRVVKALNDVPLETYSFIPEIQTADIPTFAQNYFRFFVDNDALKPTDPWPAGPIDLGDITNITAAYEPPAVGEKLRLRMDLTVGTKNLPALYQSFRLQYGKQVTSCSALAEPDWNFVGAPGSGSAWRGINATPVSGTQLSGDPPTLGDLLVGGWDRAGTYEESGGTSAKNPFAAAIGEDIEYDWILQNNAADPSSNYCFRVSTTTPGVVGPYTFYPIVRTAGFRPKTENWQWFDDETNETPVTSLALENSAPPDIAYLNKIKLRVSVQETANVTGTNVKFKLQFSEYSDFSMGVRDVVDADSCQANSLWCYADGGGLENGVITEHKISGVSCTGGVGVGCGTHNEASSTPSTFTQTANTLTEYEFTISHAGARANRTYYFRLYDVVNDIPISKNTGKNYPSLATEGAAITFGVGGLPAGTVTEGATTDIDTTSVAIPFGDLPFGTEISGAQRFTVSTNATEGYQLFVRSASDLMNGQGTIIEPVTGTNAAPSLWSVGCNPLSEGCFGYHTGDDVLAGGSTRFLANNNFAKLTATHEEIAFSSVPVTNEITDIVYRVYVTGGQSIGQYSGSLYYIVVPVF